MRGDFFIGKSKYNKAFVDSGYSERYVYEFFENIQKEGVLEHLDEKGEINFEGKALLKKLFDKYEDIKNMNSVIAANLEIEGVKNQMKNNIKGMMKNVNDLNVDKDNSRILIIKLGT